MSCKPMAPVPLAPDQEDANGFMIIDCLLPGQVRKLGANFTYLTQRRPIKTTASECEIRGGEYVAYDRADYSTALKIWLPMAQLGDAQAQTYVGEIYEKGLGLAPDYQLAAHWYGKAVEQGHSRAQINLGHLYEKGLGVERDPQRALNMYRLASGIEDEVMFASTLSASYVPRERYESVQSELARQQRQKSRLQKKLTEINRTLDQRSQALEATKKELKHSQHALAEFTRTQAETLGDDWLPSKASGMTSTEEEVLKTEINKLEAGRTELERQLANFKEQNQRLDANQKTLRGELAEAEKSQADYQRELRQIQQQLTDAEQHLAASERAVAAAEQRLQEQRESGAALTPALVALQDDLAEKSRALIDARKSYSTLESETDEQRQKLQQAVTELQRTQQALNAEKSRYQEELQSLNAALAEREQRLAATDQQLLLANAELRLERGKRKAELEQLSEKHKTELNKQQQQLAQLTSRFQQQLALVDSQKQQIEQLQMEAVSFQTEMEPPAAGAEPALAAVGDYPGIEIIEPPVVLTRSQPFARLRSLQGERLVVGKVMAPAGLMSLTVNGKTYKPNKNNLFRTEVPLRGDPTPVDVVVVDNKGRRAAVSFAFVAQDKKHSQLPPATASRDRQAPADAMDVALGDYYALIIGNNNYQHFSTLTTPVNDAEDAEKLLREKYNFKTRLLLNADRYTILSALNELRQTLTAEDNLLIYYAGHGKLDAPNNRGYWLPVDAEADNNSNWISNTAITDILNVTEAKHVLVVADSCYSGTLTKTPLARLEMDIPQDVREQWIKVMAETRARITLTSGGVEPVLDGGGGRHSVFAKAFLETLGDNDGILEGYSLYARVLDKMGTSPALADQVPQYAPIHLAGHESGEFFFAAL